MRCGSDALHEKAIAQGLEGDPGLGHATDSNAPFGRIGLKCWEIGPRDVVQMIQESVDITAALSTPNRDQATWLKHICSLVRLYVFITMSSHSFEVLHMFGLQQYSVMNGRSSFMNEWHMVFLGLGDKEAVLLFQAAMPDTVQKNGRVDAIFVSGKQEMAQHYQRQGAVTSLILPVLPTDPNVTPAYFAIALPMQNGIVRYFADFPHP